MCNNYLKNTYVLLLIYFFNVCFVEVAFSQPVINAPPRIEVVDYNKIDFATGGLNLPGLDVSIGNSDSGLTRIEYPRYYSDSLSGNFSSAQIQVSGSGGPIITTAHILGKQYKFVTGSFSGTANQINSAMSFPGPYKELGGVDPVIFNCTGDYRNFYAGGTCTLYTEDGTRIDFFQNPNLTSDPRFYFGNMTGASITKITKSNGEQVILKYAAQNGVMNVTSTLGWKVFLDKGPNDTYKTIVKSTNMAYHACINDTCDIGANSPIANYNTTTVSDTQKITYLYKNGILIHSKESIKQFDFSLKNDAWVYYKSPSGINLTGYYKYYTDVGGETITELTRGGMVWKYNWAYASSTASVFGATVTNPDGSVREVSLDGGKINYLKDELGRTTKFQYIGDGGFGGETRVEKSISPAATYVNQVLNTGAGGYKQYEYVRGNISKITEIPTGGQPNKITTFGIAATCTIADFITCNKPTYMIDPKGNRTDYTYAPEHGGILTETGPADNNGVRPQARYSYTQLSAKYLDNNGILQNFPPVYRLTQVSKCKTATAANPASCVGSADENITLYSYDSPNLFITSVTNKTGDSSISQTISYVYDEIGNKVVVDGPRTDVDDRSFATFDVLRRPVYEIDVDPDGGGPQRKKAIHHLYDIDGREWKTETGTCGTVTFSGDIPVDCADFIVTSFVRNTYDASTGLLSKTEVVQP